MSPPPEAGYRPPSTSRSSLHNSLQDTSSSADSRQRLNQHAKNAIRSVRAQPHQNNEPTIFKSQQNTQSIPPPLTEISLFPKDKIKSKQIQPAYILTINNIYYDFLIDTTKQNFRIHSLNFLEFTPKVLWKRRL